MRAARFARFDHQVRLALGACRSGLVAGGLVSGLSNVLMLTGPLYMLQVYDRVLPSRNISTLVGLSVLAFMLFGFQALTDLVRSRVMVRIGTFVDGALSELAYKADLLPVAEREAGSQPTRDLDQLRSFLLSGGPVALLDLPWIPLYAGLCFLFHPWIGYAVLIGAGLLTVPTIM